jgi:hypothetical protein
VADVVRVWDVGPAQAVDSVREWLNVVHDSPTTGASFDVQTIGSDPDPSDLNVAVSPDATYHRRFSKDGEPIHTRFRAEPRMITRLTTYLRRSENDDWQTLRRLLTDRGISPKDVAVVDAWFGADRLLTFAVVTTKHRDVLTYWAGEHPRPVGLTIEKLPGPALEDVPDKRLAEENMSMVIDAGTEMLQDEQTT